MGTYLTAGREVGAHEARWDGGRVSAVPPPSLDDLVQPGGRRAVAGVAVDLEVGVPGSTQQRVDAVPERLDRRSGGGQVAELLLGDDQVAIGADRRPVDAVPGDVGHALAVVAVAR